MSVLSSYVFLVARLGCPLIQQVTACRWLGLSVLSILLVPLSSSGAFTTMPSRAADQPGFAYTPSPVDWRNIPVYQVITDRFFDGDPANNDDNPDGHPDPAGPWSIHGGDFEGVATKLDYVRMLGAQAIWISPVVRNANGEFHGFAATDFNAIDPHWGTLADLRTLVDAAHARGMYVIIDVVQNHAGDRITSDDPGWPSFNSGGYTLRWWNSFRKHAPPFDDLGRFYNFGRIDNWNDPEQTLKGDFSTLDGINTELPSVRQDMITIFQALISATDCDGFRVDTARHVEMEFWETFLPAIESHAASIGKSNFIIFAEAWLGGDSELAPFTAPDRFNSVLYFPLRDTMESVFVWGGGTSMLTDRLNNLSLYNPSARDQLVQFLDNHDMPRYLSGGKLNGNESLLKVASSFLFTSGRVPCLYYGTEQGFNGGGDPEDREDMFDGQYEFGPSDGDNFDPTAPLYRHVRTLCLLREAYPVLVRGSFLQRWQTTSGRGLYVYSMELDGDEAVVALNTSGQAQVAETGEIGPQTFQTPGTVLVNLLDPQETVTVGQGGGTNRIIFTVPAYGTQIWVPEDQKVSLPPTVTSVSPGHDAKDVARGAKLKFTFDQPMNIGSVESGFVITPSVTGTFIWDSPHHLNFVPGTLLEANTRYTIQLAATSSGTNGMQLGSIFGCFFETGTSVIPVQEVALRHYQMDGALSSEESSTLRASANGVDLYADFNGKQFYFATRAASNNRDRFILITTQTSGLSSAPWAKAGQVAGLQHFLGNEIDNGWSGWFHPGGGGGGQSVSVNGGWLEGILDPIAAFGQIPSKLYIASVPYETPNGGALDAAQQCPAGDGDGDVEQPEYFLLDVSSFDTDGDGLPDLQEDANANGAFDPGETRALVFDTDADGMSDGEEYTAGTNPNDPESLFVSEIEMVNSTGQVAVRWMGLSGHRYTVWAAQLSGGVVTWVPTPMQNVAGEGSLLEYVEAVSVGDPARVFRIQVSRLE